MNKFRFRFLLALVTLSACQRQYNKSVETASTRIPNTQPCQASELAVLNELRPSKMLYQQQCLSYADKTSDLNLAHVLETTPLGLMNKLIFKALGKEAPRPKEPILPGRWDPAFLRQYPFDINPVSDAATAFVPNAGQEKQLTLPGYSQFAELNRDKVYIGRQPSIDVYRFLKMFAAVVRKTNIAPFMGQIHRFSIQPHELEANLNRSGEGMFGGQFVGLTREATLEAINNKAVSKIFLALSLGVTSRVLYTGGERAVLEFLRSKANGSVQFHELLEFSYRMHKGDVYLTLLTLENTLSRWWRLENRDKLMSTQKLANITNSYMGRDDKYGAWYHFLGVALLGLVEGDFASVVADVESEGSVILNRMNNVSEDETQENEINAVGAKFGIRLAALLQQMETVGQNERVQAIASRFSVTADSEVVQALRPENYLNLNEDFRDRMLVTLSPELKASASGALLLATGGASLSGCRVEIFPVRMETKTRDSSLVRQFVSNLSATPKEFALSAWPANAVSLSGARVFVSGCKELGGKVLVAETPNAN